MHRLVTAIVLAIIQSIAEAVLVTWIIAKNFRGSDPLWWIITCGVVGIGASVFACVEVGSKERAEEIDSVADN